MCPRCRQTGLYSTGAFWICGACGLAITHQALKFEQERAGIVCAGIEEGRHGNQTARQATQGSEKPAQAAKRIS